MYIHSLFKKIYLFLVHVYGCFACIYVYAPHMCPVSKEARRGQPIPCNELQMAVSHHLGARIQPRSSGRASSTLNHWTISWALHFLFRILFSFLEGRCILKLKLCFKINFISDITLTINNATKAEFLKYKQSDYNMKVISILVCKTWA